MVYLMKFYFSVHVVFRFVLFNFQSLDRVYNKRFGGDNNITFYAFPKQSKHSAHHSSRQPLIIFCPHDQ